MNRTGKRASEESSFCYFHPKQRFIGVCPLCLNERLLALAARKPHYASSSTASQRLHSLTHRKPPPSSSASSIHNKIFAFGSLFTRPHKSHNLHYEYDASPIPEESFISIKFEGNGVASWEKNTVSEVSLESCNVSWSHPRMMIQKKDRGRGKSVIEHGRSREALRWRKRIGHVFHVIRLKNSMRGSACHVGSKVEGVKRTRNGWMRTLTKSKRNTTTTQ